MTDGDGVGRQAAAHGCCRKRDRSLEAVGGDEGKGEEASGVGCGKSSGEGGEEGRRPARGGRTETREKERVGK